MKKEEDNKSSEKIPELKAKEEIKKETDFVSNSDENIQDILPPEILEEIPVGERGRISTMIKETMISGVIKGRNPLTEKITPEHITQIINRSDVVDQRDRKERSNQRVYTLLYVILGLLFTAFLIIYLQQDKETLIKIIISAISFVGGLGLGKSFSKKTE